MYQVKQCNDLIYFILITSLKNKITFPKSKIVIFLMFLMYKLQFNSKRLNLSIVINGACKRDQ